MVHLVSGTIILVTHPNNDQENTLKFLFKEHI